MSRLSAVIMAHRQRAAFIPELQAKLDRDVPVIWDRRDDRWDTGRRAMLAYDPSATHHLVLQDDAIVCHDLLAGIEKSLEWVPEQTPVSLYVGKNPYKMGLVRLGAGVSWLQLDLNWGVGIVMPTSMITPAIAWCDTQVHVANYDKRLSRWIRDQGRSVWCPWPSLVNHRQTPSLVPGRSHNGRVAFQFIGEDASALDADWSGRVIALTPRSVKLREVGEHVQ